MRSIFLILLGVLALSAVAAEESLDLELLDEIEDVDSGSETEAEAPEEAESSDESSDDAEESEADEDLDEEEERRRARRRSRSSRRLSRKPKTISIYNSPLKKEISRLRRKLTKRAVRKFIRVHQAFCNRSKKRTGRTPALCRCKRGSKKAHCRRLRSVVCETVPTHPVCEKPKNEECPVGSEKDSRLNNRCVCFEPALMVQGKCVCPAPYVLNAAGACIQKCPANAVASAVDYPERCDCQIAYKWVNGACNIKECPIHTALNLSTGQCDTTHKRCPPNSAKSWVLIDEKCQCQSTHIQVCRGQDCTCQLQSCPKGYKPDVTGTRCEVEPCPGNSKPIVKVVDGKSQTVCASTRTDCPVGSVKPFVDESKGEVCQCALPSAAPINGKCVDKCKSDEQWEQQSGADGKCAPKYKQCPLYAAQKEVRFNQTCECTNGRALKTLSSDTTEECECVAGTHDEDGKCEPDYKKCPSGSVKSKVWYTEKCECKQGLFLRDNSCSNKPPSPCPVGQFRSKKHGFCTIRCPRHTQFRFAVPRLGESCQCHNNRSFINGKCIKACNRNQRRVKGKCISRCPNYSVKSWARVCRCSRGYFWSRGRCLEACPVGQALFRGECHKHCGQNSVKSFVRPDDSCECESGFVRKSGRCIEVPKYGCPKGFFMENGQCQRIMLECSENSVNWFVNRKLGEKCSCAKGFFLKNGVCTSTPKSRRCPNGHRRVRGRCFRRCPRYSRTAIVEFGKQCECQQGRVFSKKNGRCVLPKCAKDEFRLKGVCSIRCPLFSKQMFIPSGAVCQCESGYLMQNDECVPKPCAAGEKRVLGACVIECPERSVHAFVPAGSECQCEKGLNLVDGKCQSKPATDCKNGLTRFNGICGTRCPTNSVFAFSRKNRCRCEEGYTLVNGECAITPIENRCRGYTLLRAGKCQFRCPYASQVEFVVKYDQCKCKDGFVMKGSFPIQYCERIRNVGCPYGYVLKDGICVAIAEFTLCPSFSVKRKVKVGETCQCQEGRILDGNICILKASFNARANATATVTTTTTTTTTTTLYKTTEERLSSMEQMHAWAMRAEQQGQTQLSASVTEYAKLEVKLDQAQAVLQTTTEATVKAKMAEKVAQLEAEQAQVKAKVVTLRAEAGNANSATPSDDPERKSLDDWLANVKNQAVQELAFEIDSM